MANYLRAADELEAQLDGIDLGDFCKEWQEKWRGVAVTLQGLLKLVFPLGAKILGILIEVADRFCSD